MSKSQRLRFEHIREAFRLVGEARELGTDPTVWRTHVLSRLGALIGARVGIGCEQSILANGQDVRFNGMMNCGWTPAQNAIFFDYVQQGLPMDDPLHPTSRKHTMHLYTGRRREMVDDRTWYDSPLTSEIRRAADTDDTLFSRTPLFDSWGNMFVLCRNWGERPFDSVHGRILHFFHEELAREWAPGSGAPPIPSRRLRQTLTLLQSGQSEKQIAAELELSRHTVHEYVKRVYRHFSASSRSELLVRASQLKLPAIRLTTPRNSQIW